MDKKVDFDNEIKVNEANFDDPTFDYVVEIKEGAKVCFGSTVKRDTALIGKGLAPHQRRITAELLPNIGPGLYSPEQHSGAMYDSQSKARSTAGVSGLVNKALRFDPPPKLRIPSPTRYRIVKEMGIVKTSLAPFGVNSNGREVKVNDIPSASTYNVRMSSKCRKTKMMHNLGRPRAVNAVETRCVAIPTDTCLKCRQVCKGDYWHKDYMTFLCHLCWEEEHRMHEIYSKKQLRRMKKLRNCAFMHRHEDTSAAVRILPQNKINKKIRIENYLNLFLTCEKERY